jgi:signal transduction histidine kinase
MELARDFAHDMKNLLGIVLGYTNLLLEDLPPDDARRTDLDEIRRAAEQALTLVERRFAASPEPSA